MQQNSSYDIAILKQSLGIKGGWFMYKDYISDGNITGITKQHNIMVLVGNGFDISVLQKYRDDQLTPSYKVFYDFLKYRGIRKDNVLFNKMTVDRDTGKENWSDFENSLFELLDDCYSVEVLEKALQEIQSFFLLFLNDVVTPDISIKLNDNTEAHQWGKKSLTSFLGDLDEEEFLMMDFPLNTQHYHMFNYLFVNFNYTSLLDNYIFLDKSQFEPHPYKTVDTNFTFLPNPNGYGRIGIDENTKWSTFVMTNIIHPHGYQRIPRSMLFGVESSKSQQNRSTKRLVKSYWAQNNQKYRSYFDNTELFIIYGASLGTTDSWWWKNIFNSVLVKKSELIIYTHSLTDKDAVKQKFIEACQEDYGEKEKIAVSSRIFVVPIENGKTSFLSLEE